MGQGSRILKSKQLFPSFLQSLNIIANLSGTLIYASSHNSQIYWSDVLSGWISGNQPFNYRLDQDIILQAKRHNVDLSKPFLWRTNFLYQENGENIGNAVDNDDDDDDGSGSAQKFEQEIHNIGWFDDQGSRKAIEDLQTFSEYQIDLTDADPLEKIDQVHVDINSENDHIAPAARVFPALENDVILVAPIKTEKSENFTHLKSFIDTASIEKQKKFWKVVGETVQRLLYRWPKVCVSVHGGGVSYLHVRLQREYKYYDHPRSRFLDSLNEEL